MLGRVRPDDEARTVRKADAMGAAWAADSHWKNLSQRSRIVRWLTSRPTRMATMYVIREALAQPR
jgi:nuclear transport factor 2 (NTF2) superfamily protein